LKELLKGMKLWSCLTWVTIINYITLQAKTSLKFWDFMLISLNLYPLVELNVVFNGCGGKTLFGKINFIRIFMHDLYMIQTMDTSFEIAIMREIDRDTN